MSTIGTMYNHSPHSSSGIFGSTEGTPDTRLTALSPEDARPLKVACNVSGGVHSGITQSDPFVTSAANSQSKLSATASTFRPIFHIPAEPTSTLPSELTFTAAAALAFSKKKLDGMLDQYKSAKGVQHDIVTLSVGPQDSQQGDINFRETFSTDTDITRCIQITNIYHADSSVAKVVVIALEMLKAKYKFKGSERIEHGISAAYLRYSHIDDAVKVYTTLNTELPQYTLEYISPAVFASAVKSPTKGSYSAHEGQVVLTARYPVGTPYNKKVFEDGMRALVSAEGNLHAWQKLGATEAGTFRLVAEFCDSALALHAVQRLNGKNIKCPQGDVIVSLDLHTPDLYHSSHHLDQMSTPTRRSEEHIKIDGALSRMTLNCGETLGFTGGLDTIPASVVGSLVMPYMASNAGALNPSFGLQPALPTQPVVIDRTYGAEPSLISHGYTSGLHQQYISGDFNPTATGVGAFNQSNAILPHHRFENVYSKPLAALSSFNQHGYQQPGLQQHGGQHQNYGYDPAFANPLSYGYHRENAYFNGPKGHRQGFQRAPRHSARGRQFPIPSATGHHNHVDVHRIRQGIDVRTTVMLRNIPNKVDQAMLKEIVDESSFGRYDFMYLRIDFSNDCNVGYAFINFTDPLDIIDFVVARSNQKWHRFKSDKVAEVSYATIQGRDCLIQKFRNSSVMLEPPHYRPKLFFSIHDPTGRAGEEDQFPASDNASKLKRSCENAENVGLFAPSAGQHLRDEQRRRRSQFDRGTSLAEREDYGYEDGSTHSGYRPFFYG